MSPFIQSILLIYVLIISFQIMATANEGLRYLDERKDFWQQQKPVYARRNEMLTPQKARRPKSTPKKTPSKKRAPKLSEIGQNALLAN